MKRVKNYYVLSHRFNGYGTGFAKGFDSRLAAQLYAWFILWGFAQILTDFDLELRYPGYYHSLISFTA